VNASTGRAGAIVVGLYLLAAAVTLALAGHRYLPLFEGIGPPPKYLWVHPPPAFAPGNTVPQGDKTDFALTGPAEPTFAETPDGQFSINLPPGAFAPHDGDTNVHAVITALDPANLGPIAPGEVADGNAYQIVLTYTPSGTPVPALRMPGNLVLVAPYTADAIYRSLDGRTWTKLASQVVSGPAVLGSTFDGPGYYVVGTAPHRLRTATSAASSSTSGTALVAALAVAVALLLGGFAALTVIRRRRMGEE